MKIAAFIKQATQNYRDWKNDTKYYVDGRLSPGDDYIYLRCRYASHSSAYTQNYSIGILVNDKIIEFPFNNDTLIIDKNQHFMPLSNFEIKKYKKLIKEFEAIKVPVTNFNTTVNLIANEILFHSLSTLNAPEYKRNNFISAFKNYVKEHEWLNEEITQIIIKKQRKDLNNMLSVGQSSEAELSDKFGNDTYKNKV